MNLKRASSFTLTFKVVLFLGAVIGKCANDNLVDAKPCGRCRTTYSRECGSRMVTRGHGWSIVRFSGSCSCI
jgi:hypothetical protein